LGLSSSSSNVRAGAIGAGGHAAGAEPFWQAVQEAETVNATKIWNVVWGGKARLHTVWQAVCALPPHPASPLGRGGLAVRLPSIPETLGLRTGCQRFSLSPRERAGVRGTRHRTVAADPNTSGTLQAELQKVELAWELRSQTTMPLAWIAERLHMGSRGHLAWLLQRRGKSGTPPPPANAYWPDFRY